MKIIEELEDVEQMREEALLPPYVLSETERQAIEEGRRDIAMGRVRPWSEIKKSCELWLQQLNGQTSYVPTS